MALIAEFAAHTASPPSSVVSDLGRQAGERQTDKADRQGRPARQTRAGMKPRRGRHETTLEKLVFVAGAKVGHAASRAWDQCTSQLETGTVCCNRIVSVPECPGKEASRMSDHDVLKSFAVRVCAIFAMLSSCSAGAGPRSATPLPDGFAPPDTSPDFTLPIELKMLERRIRGSKCKAEDKNVSSLGLSTGMAT